MTLTSNVTNILSLLTIFGNILIGYFLILFIFKKEIKVSGFLKKNALLFAFIVALIATSGSLFYSEIAGYDPCKLCWFQRIFMYPLIILFGIALIKKTRSVVHYAIPMSIIGGFIAAYHYAIQRLNYSASCSADGTSCTAKYMFHYGYITIPMMALTAFILIIILCFILRSKNRQKVVKSEEQ